MADKQAIYDFAMKWMDIFINPETPYVELFTSTMAEDYQALGIEEEAGPVSFEKYRLSHMDLEELAEIIEMVEDTELLAAAIDAKWHSINKQETVTDEESEFENRAWFLFTLSRLLELLEEDLTLIPELDQNLIRTYIDYTETMAEPFEGIPSKIRLISNNHSYGPWPEPTDEIEQRLTIYAKGRVWLSVYAFGEPDESYQLARRKNFAIDQSQAVRVLNTVAAYFKEEYYEIFATDVGVWELEITNTEGRTFKYRGSLIENLEVDDVDLSELIREALGMDDLYVFDEGWPREKILRIAIEYHARKKIIGNQEDVTNDIHEKLVIDRASETIEHIQSRGSEYTVSRKYHLAKKIYPLLDSFDEEELFNTIPEYLTDIIDNSNESREYTITVDFAREDQRVIKGKFDADGLPDGWAEFAETVSHFMNTHDCGHLLNRWEYMRRKRRVGELIFCSVEFNGGYQTYYYLSDDDQIQEGDWVLVPVGEGGQTSKAEVVEIEYFTAEEAPYPLDKIKHIIKRLEIVDCLKFSTNDGNNPIDCD